MSGRALSRLGPIAGAEVTLEGLRARSDPAGRFAIAEVPGGRHLLRAEANGRPVGEVMVEVDGDTVADVSMLGPLELVVTDSTPHSISLAWGAASDSGFRSYRLVRSYTVDMAPETSSVVFESDEPSATFYLDSGLAEEGGLQPDQSHFYRVYAENDRGTAASAVVEARTRLWDGGDFELQLELTTGGQIAGAANTTALTWDGDHIWLAYYKEIGGYWDDDENWLVEMSADGAEVGRLDIAGRHLPIQGLTWFGERLWIAWASDSADQHDDLQEVDPATGEVLRTFAVPHGTVDLDQDGTHILVLNRWNELYRVDPADGSVDATFALPFSFGTLTGVAQQDDRIMLSSWMHDELAIFDLDGHQIGAAVGHARRGGVLAFAGDRLAQGGGARYLLQDLLEVEP